MHKAQALVFRCIDFRFQEIIDDYLKNRGLTRKFDNIGLGGASKNFDVCLEQAKLSLDLHDPDEVYIVEHEDCGAYGEDNSEETHRANAKKLAQALTEIKPSLKVTPLIATFDGIKPL